MKYCFRLQRGLKISIAQVFLSMTECWVIFLTHDHFIKPKAEKRKIPFLVTKMGKKLNPIIFFDPRLRNCGWFHLLFLLNDHFIKTKSKKMQNTVFGYKKGSKVHSDKIF